MTLRHWQMEKVSGSAEPLLSTTGNKGLDRSGGSSINYSSTALFGKFSVAGKNSFDTDAAGSLSDNEFTVGFWFRLPSSGITEHHYVFQLGKHNTDVALNGHTCVGITFSTYSNKLFFTTGYKNADGGIIELGSASRNTWYHCYISRTNSGTNSTLQVKITQTDGTVVHDESEVYTKADFSIDESGTGAYSYFMGHPAGGSLSIGGGLVEDFILKNGSVLSYASIYNSSAEVFQSDEPQVSVSTGAGSATLSDSNFTGTKTYSFYDTDAETLLQSGTSNSYTSYASSSVAYTALVSDTDNNRVISTFFISQGGNDMPFFTGSASDGAISYQYNWDNIGAIGLDQNTGAVLSALPVTGSGMPLYTTSQMLSSSFAASSGSLVQALNYLQSQVDSSNDAAGSEGNIQFKGSDGELDAETQLNYLKADNILQLSGGLEQTDGATIGNSSVPDFITLAAAQVTFKDGALDVDIASHDGSNGLKLGGALVTSTAAELNLLDTAAAGTVVNEKAVIYSAAGNVQGSSFAMPNGGTIGNAAVGDFITMAAAQVTFKDGALDVDIASHDGSNGLKLGGSLVTSTAAELNLLDTAAANTVVNSKAVIYGSSGEVKVGSLLANAAGSSAIGSADAEFGSAYFGTGAELSFGSGQEYTLQDVATNGLMLLDAAAGDSFFRISGSLAPSSVGSQGYFGFPGTDDSGVWKDYKIVVEGGILKAVATN